MEEFKVKYENLVTKRLNLLAKLYDMLDKKQFKVFQEYLQVDEKLNKKFYADLLHDCMVKFRKK